MTDNPAASAELQAEIDAVAAQIDGLAAGAADRAALEARVSDLCDAVLARPPGEAKTFLPVLEQLIARLDAAATVIQQRGGDGDSPAPARSARSAAAAYGAGQNRRRRGF
ncbi:hypothetical protein T8K17_23320 [Thalassobaculum sp. OXR-137]|uniref:hypothetical protein n=1 Tax=Thalassobaculum sp. OXR-137 TaxID=3100173 RepID=UPI002AC9C5C7|nr:hypothetical protein [Thalassobaculum sp. OXR-137]WPZ34150.1 hypothetical protein T8K17_23320 [Thalassobaculum sp. OXR-137]